MYSDVWSFWVLHKLGLFCFVFVFASQFAVCLQVFWTPPNTTGGGLLCRDYPYIWIIPIHTLLRFLWVWFDSCCSVACYLSWFLLDLWFTINFFNIWIVINLFYYTSQVFNIYIWYRYTVFRVPALCSSLYWVISDIEVHDFHLEI